MTAFKNLYFCLLSSNDGINNSDAPLVKFLASDSSASGRGVGKTESVSLFAVGLVEARTTSLRKCSVHVKCLQGAVDIKLYFYEDVDM